MSKQQFWFLLRSRPKSLRDIDGIDIVEGFVGSRSDEGIWIQRVGKEYFLISCGREPSPSVDCRIPISKEAYNAMWPLTAGKRSASLFFAYKDLGGMTWAINEYHAGFNGIVTGMVILSEEEIDVSVESTINELILEEVGHNYVRSKILC